MPIPAAPGRTRNPLAGYPRLEHEPESAKDRMRRLLGLKAKAPTPLEVAKKIEATPAPDLVKGAAAPVVNPDPQQLQAALAYAGLAPADANICNGVYDDTPRYMGIDWGADLGNGINGGTFNNALPDTLLGGHVVSQDLRVEANGSLTINKTYAVPGIEYHPGVVNYLEKAMAASVTGINETWGKWTQGNYIQAINTSQITWSTWASNSATAYNVPGGTITIQASNVSTGTYIVNQQVLQGNWANWATQYHESKEQKEKRVAAAKEQERVWLERKKAEDDEKARVKTRAEKILVRHLDTKQALHLKEKGHFDVEVGDKTYRIWRGTHGNIRELNKEGKEIASLCVQPNGVPTEDAMLAQLLWLRADEKALLRVANRTQLRVQ